MKNRIGIMMGVIVAASLSAMAMTMQELLSEKPSPVGQVLSPWQKGDLDIHFIHTGTGENTFYIFPDGTTMLLDCGDWYDSESVARQPSAERLGGEWTARYISRVIPQGRTHIDYLLVSHWHSDHTGLAAYSKTRDDGYVASGISAVAEQFTFGTFYDHQYPTTNRAGSAEMAALRHVQSFLASSRAAGMVRGEFRVGALNQIAQLTPEGAADTSFFVRNVCADMKLWTGSGEDCEDLFAVHKQKGGAKLNENSCSSALLIGYGPFRFFTGGDVNGRMLDADGNSYLYDEKIGQVVGRVTIAKANHHASPDSMSAAFVNALGARNYLVNVWHPVHINDTTMSRMASGGAERVYATYIPPEDEALIASAAWRTVLDPRGGHVVIRVTDGGKRYNILRLSAENESMVVTACDRYSVSR